MNETIPTILDYFSSIKPILFLSFFHHLGHNNPTFLQDAMIQELILCLTLFLKVLCCLNLLCQAVNQTNYCQDGKLDLKSSLLKRSLFWHIRSNKDIVRSYELEQVFRILLSSDRVLFFFFFLIKNLRIL